MAEGARDQAVARRESDVRHAYLLELGDALRPLADPVDIQATASRVLGEHLGASRVTYIDVRGSDYCIERDYTNGVPQMAGRYPIAAFGDSILQTYRAGGVAVGFDVAADASLSAAERAAYAAIQVGAYIGVPLIKNGEFVVVLAVHVSGPRQWTQDEITRVEETAERTWAAVERARAEQALARSEEKYRTLFTNIDEAFAVCELIYDEAGRPHDRILLEANPRYEEMTGRKAAVGSRARDVYPDIEDYWFDRYHEVVSTGNAVRVENYSASLKRWFDVYISRVGGQGSREFVAVFNEITERKRREANLAFLSETSRDLVSLTNIAETMAVLGAKIGRYLDVASCSFAEIDETAAEAAVGYEWHREGVKSIVGLYRIPDFLDGETRNALRAGRAVAIADTRTDPRVNAGLFADLGVAAFINVPVLSDDRRRFVLFVHDPEPRAWRADQVELMHELGDRIWTRLARARAEQALQSSDERHKALFSQMLGGVAEADLGGRFTNVNRRYCEMVGYQAAELMGRRIQELSHPDDVADSMQLIGRTIRDGTPFEVEKRYIRKDGSVIWVHNSVSAVSDAAGRRRGIIAVSVDVTDRRQQQEEIRRGTALLDFLIDRSPTGFYIVDADFRISHMNADSQARAFRNVNPAIGRRFDEAIRVIWPEPVANEIIGHFRHTLETGEAYFSPGLVSERADLPEVETYDWQVQRITMPDGRHAVVCYYYDTTQLRAAEQELREADRRKDEFLATLAHELRNPLAPLRNGIRLLRRGRANANDISAVHEMMERQVSHMVRLVDDLMEVSRITRGKVELRRELTDLHAVIHDAVETSKPLIDAAGHELSLTRWSGPLAVHADAVRMTQVFANLLNNAAKYTDTGGGRIAVTLSQEGSSALVSVQDNGIGIPADMLPRVFDLFTQADRAYSRAQGGLGIGLTLVRSMVEMHGGSVDARSDGPGRGSVFVVRLPLAARSISGAP